AQGAPLNEFVHIEDYCASFTPLMLAAGDNHINIVEKLLNAGADVDTMTTNNATSLIMACKNGHLETVRLLLAAKANVNHKNQRSETALLWAMTDRRHSANFVNPRSIHSRIEIIKLLIEASAE